MVGWESKVSTQKNSPKSHSRVFFERWKKLRFCGDILLPRFSAWGLGSTGQRMILNGIGIGKVLHGI